MTVKIINGTFFLNVATVWRDQKSFIASIPFPLLISVRKLRGERGANNLSCFYKKRN